MRWQDSGFNTEDCSLMGIHCFRNLKADKIAPRKPCNGIYPRQFVLNLQQPKEDWTSLPTSICYEKKIPFFCSFLVATVASPAWKDVNCRKQFYLVLPGRSQIRNQQFFQELKQKCQFLVWTRVEVLDLKGVSAKTQLNESSAVASIFSLPFWMVPNRVIFVGIQMDHWFHPM